MKEIDSLKDQDATHKATLKAIQHVTELLEEQVIPKLPDEPNEEEAEETPGSSTDASQGQIPVTVQQALGDVCRGLSADQATALASLFTAVESGPYDDGEPQAKPTPAHGRASPGPRTIALEPNAKIGPTGKVLLQILEHYPQKSKISIYSAYRPGEPDHHGGQSINGSPTAALDIIGGKAPGMRDVAKWLYNNFAAETLELIHTTPFDNDDGFYVKNGKKNPGGDIYGPELREQHRDHVHFATSEALAKKILARLNKKQSRASTPAAAPVWGWDASSYDWDRGPMNLEAAKKDGILFFTHKCSEHGSNTIAHFAEGLARARKAGIPVLGAYHVLWPGKPIEEARFFFSQVNTKVPWWKEVPWIWQLDAEEFPDMPRKPSPQEAQRSLNELKRLAGSKGYFIAYAPKSMYQDSFNIGYDLWASNYTGSGAPRSFREQYKGVPASSWAPYSGRKPRILQFASDATIGTQRQCDANRFDGDLNTLIKLTGHKAASAAAPASSVEEEREYSYQR